MREVFWFLLILSCTMLTWFFGGRAAPTDGLWPFLAWFLPGVWAPTVIALVVVASAKGPAGAAREVRARLSYKPGAARWLLLAAAMPVCTVAGAVFAARAAGDAAAFIPSRGIAQMVGLQIITGAIGEELGWRGFLLPRLRKQFGALAAAWVMGILWSLWHLPAFFTSGLPHQVMPMLLVLPFITFFGVFMAFVFNRAGESVLATMAAHLSLNIMTGVGGAEFSSRVFWGVLMGVFGLIAVPVTIKLRALPQVAAARLSPDKVNSL
jgi:membrane protease YdiL (CAAX protease family)